MKIVSKFPQNWPHLNFSLKAGENEVDENKIPLAAHAKLAFLSVARPALNADDKPEPVITGYTPSPALVSAADTHARKARVKPPVATLETVTAPSVGAQPATPADKAVVDKANADAHRLVEGNPDKRRDQR